MYTSKVVVTCNNFRHVRPAVRPFVCLSACIIAAPTGRISVKIGTGTLKIQIWFKSGTLSVD